MPLVSNSDEASREVITPALEALDLLRCALDAAIDSGDGHAAGMLIWAIQDLVDAIDVICARAIQE